MSAQKIAKEWIKLGEVFINDHGAKEMSIMPVAGGVLVKVAELQFDPDHCNPSISTSVCFVPGASLEDFYQSETVEE